MPTEKKKAASRANGSKSNGPKTDEGKARSSQNAVKHGYSTNIMTIPGEDHERFHILRDAFVLRFDPIDLVELDQVELMAFSTWVIRRCCNAQKLTFTASIETHREGIDAIYEDVDENWHAAWAVAREAAEPSIKDVQRYHAHWRRQYRQSYTTLLHLQANRPQPLAPENEKMQNEPTEPITPVESTADSVAEPPASPAAPAAIVRNTLRTSSHFLADVHIYRPLAAKTVPMAVPTPEITPDGPESSPPMVLRMAA